MKFWQLNFDLLLGLYQFKVLKTFHKTIHSQKMEANMKMVLFFTLIGLFSPIKSSGSDLEELVSNIKQTWKDIAQKKPVDTTGGHPEGQWIATSEGGLWQFITNEEAGTMITESPNILNFKPHHIKVRIVGEKKDVAYAAFYLVGNILNKDRNVIVQNYRTRASQVWVKLNGNWAEIASHYSPLYAGSGVVLD